MKTMVKINGNTPLERHVAKWINSHAVYSNYGAEGVLADLLKHGCQSGMVGHLCYYHDTVKFYKRFRVEIEKLLYETLEENGLDAKGLFGDKWDPQDPLARDTMNQNLLAWFGFEETARKLADQAGLEI